ncbi:MAG: hypothetical protein ACI9LU_002934 [Polaribacter sp.]|jgi:hypothetical protein
MSYFKDKILVNANYFVGSLLVLNLIGALDNAFNSVARSAIIIFIVANAAIVPAAKAQQVSPQKMAVLLATINSLLLFDRDSPIPLPSGASIELAISDLVDGPLLVTDQQQIFGQIPLQEQGVEFCFDVSANQALSPGDFVVEVNGNAVAAMEGKDICYQIPEHQQRLINYIVIRVLNPAVTLNITRIGLESNSPVHLGLPRTTRGTWNERAVRKVLKIFAFGGHARDGQIQDWADMDAFDAIQEMLTFAEHNLLLSPLATSETYTDSDGEAGSSLVAGTLTEWLTFISSDSSNIPYPAVGSRESFGLNGYKFDDGYNRMIAVRGMNPFRQKIGFWETNYHLATNLDTSVTRPQMARYYDEIMQAHEAESPYHKVMGVAAKSAAAAMQYGHRFNQWNQSTGECECNDDFAREIHQLYYGIFGEGAPYHEDLTIPETAKLLTDMQVRYNGDLLAGYPLDVDFQADDHHTAGVYVFKPNDGSPNITGATAEEKITALMPISMQHPESLKNLPVMIISALADDNLSEGRKDQLRASWASMGVDRKLLDFIQAYAISNLLHSSQHFKYLSTHDRALYIANKSNFENIEAYHGGVSRIGRTVGSIVSEDFAGDFFRPIHNVFGGQTSIEASDSSLAFENNYNRLTDREGDLRRATDCDTCDLGQPWEKKWAEVLPQRSDGNFYVSDVAKWLWNHVVGHMDNYTELERAHLYVILGAARINPGSTSDGVQAYDFNLLMCVVADHKFDPEPLSPDATITEILSSNRWDDFCRGDDDGGDFLAHELAELNAQYTGALIEANPQIQEVLSELGNLTIPLNASGVEHSNDGENLRHNARERVSSALGFIFTTPFVFAEGQ